jgi:hypothetical protein
MILENAAMFIAGIGEIQKAEYISSVENVALFDTLKLALNLP